MRVLVFNAGSSSLKIGLFDIENGPGDPARPAQGVTQRLKGSFERFADGGCHMSWSAGDRRHSGRAPHADLGAAMSAVPALLEDLGMGDVHAVGHRMVHGGPTFTRATVLDDAALAQIETLTPLAPLHNPANLRAVRLARSVWPGLPQVGVFDTAFHLSAPTRATTYAVPKAWREAGLRRYGFHGTSHKYVALRAAEALGQPLRMLRLISVHLGNGASACAVQWGQSLDTSMGLTPLEGLVMGTRSGDVDPGAFGYLHRTLGLSIDEIERALNNDSGLKGLTGVSDMRDVEARAEAGDADARHAINLYAYRVRKYIGAYTAAMGGCDAIVFTGGIGENSPAMRRRICDGLEFMGLRLDNHRNIALRLTEGEAVQIQALDSRVAVIVTETAEQLMIAREAALALAPSGLKPGALVPVAVSARHVHLSQAAVDVLFGDGYRLTPERPLRQPGNWIARERVALRGPRGTLEHVAILGPLRGRTQIEVSRSDSFVLGLDAPVRDSGALDDTPRVTLVGPEGEFETDGLIIAARHIHTNPEDAEALGLRDGQVVSVRLGDELRGLTLARTLVRVSPGAATEMHIDTDEANAAGLRATCEGELLPLDAASAEVIARANAG